MATAEKSDAPLTPIEVQNFSTENDRKRLTATAIKAFCRLAEFWDLSNVEAAALLGVSLSTWERIKRGAGTRQLTQDHLTRISALVGIFKGLSLLFADDMGKRWVHLKNKGPLFNRASPVEAMIDGGIPLMIEIRRYVDAVRGGI
jgi:hypothetical protein